MSLTSMTDVLPLVPYLCIGGFIALVAWVLRGSMPVHPWRPSDAPVIPLIEPLTQREADVLGLAASGLSTGRIGDQLYLSIPT